MKIGHTGGNIPLTQGVGDKPSAVKQAAPKPVEGAAISLSVLSTQLQALEAKMADTGHFDASRVESIKRAIQSGQFKVNPEAIADKLIASVRELVGK